MADTMAVTAGPDLVVLDLGLPDVPGERVVREVRAVTVLGGGYRLGVAR